MKHYINKDTLVAEIEKELNTTKKYSTEYVNGKKYALKKILSFLDSLEVKEEVTTTDAFIEKAYAYLKDRIEHDSIDYPMARMSLIDEFRKYMKGEKVWNGLAQK